MPKEAESYNFNQLSESNVKKNVLPYYGLENADITQVKFKDTEKQRAVYKVDYNNQSYCLKKVYFKVPDLLFVYSAIEWFYRSGINVPRILPTLSNGRFVEYNDMLFILTPWIEGVKCSYDNMDHIVESSRNLANMHICSENFYPITGSSHKNNIDNILVSLQKHFQQLLNSSNLAFKYKDRFSKVFLQNFDVNITMAQIALNVSSTINMDNLKRSLCHMDYVNKNIIFDGHNNLWVIDFDKCKIDYCIHDIAYYLRRLLRRDNTRWNMEIALKSLNAYEEVRTITIDEYKYLIAYLAFPQKFWKISRDYYNNIKKCNKQSFITLINKTIEKNDSQLQFIREFCSYIEEKCKQKIT